MRMNHGITSVKQPWKKNRSAYATRSLVIHVTKKGKGSPYTITERRVPELILVLSSQPAGGTVGCHYFPPGLQLPSQPLRRLLPMSLLGEQMHDGCEQFA